MFRKLFAMAMAALMMLTGTAAMADPFEELQPVAPEEPIETDAENVRIVATYDSETGRSTYRLTLKDGAAFADGTAITAQDLIFTYYYYLDPGYDGQTSLDGLEIPGLASYRMQCAPERLEQLLETMTAIAAAGEDHVWSESDGWSEALQETYWSLYADYRAAADAQFPVLAQMLVDYYSANIPSGGALGYTAEEIAASDDLKVAYTMVTWGYATYSEDAGELITTRSRRVWNIADGLLPNVDDFGAELSLVYDGDLAVCWATECPDPSAAVPELPDVETEFLRAAIGDALDEVGSIDGIRMIDDATVEVDLEGINVSSAGALFGIDVFSLSACGDASQWDPDAGLYGHPFGDVSGVQAEGGVRIYEADSTFGSLISGQ